MCLNVIDRANQLPASCSLWFSSQAWEWYQPSHLTTGNKAKLIISSKAQLSIFIYLLYLTSLQAFCIPDKIVALSKINMFSFQLKQMSDPVHFSWVQKSGRLHRKQPGLCLYRVPGTIGFSAKGPCLRRTLLIWTPIKRDRQRRREGTKEGEKHREAGFRDTQKKASLVMRELADWGFFHRYGGYKQQTPAAVCFDGKARVVAPHLSVSEVSVIFFGQIHPSHCLAPL